MPNPADIATEVGHVDDAFAICEAPSAPLDRSTLEAYATCPFQGHAIETKRVTLVGEIAVAGDLAHQALMTAVATLCANGSTSPGDLRLEVENAMVASRPDLQPDVIRAVRPVLWSWISFLCDREHGVNPANILAFDGGEEFDRSGQLALDVAGVRVTSELDFVFQPASLTELEEIDFKTGHAQWSSTDVKTAFQFVMHAALLLHHFPEVETVNVRVWNSRTNNLTGRVAFLRERRLEYVARIASAVDAREEALAAVSRGVAPETWPTVEKCGICPCVRFCPAADAQVSGEPESDLAAYIVSLERVKALKKSLTKWIDAHGPDRKSVV